MKRRKILSIALVLLAVALVITCNKGSDWAVKIDDDVITMDEFYQFYYSQGKMILNLEKDKLEELSKDPQLAEHPLINKKKFMDYLLSRKLLYKKAMEDEDINKEELKAFIEFQKLDAAARYYILEKHKDEINVSDAEADQFYAANKERFRGVPINDKIIEGIKQQIFMKKLEQKSSEFILNLIAESKVNREGFNKHLKEEAKEKDKKKKKEDKKEDKK